jgi:hypothetical protein
LLNSAWIKARERANLTATVRVHDLKHTFGRRLRAAGVSFKDRQVRILMKVNTYNYEREQWFSTLRLKA